MLGKVVSCLLHGHQLCQDLPPRQGTSAATGSHLGWDSTLRLADCVSICRDTPPLPCLSSHLPWQPRSWVRPPLALWLKNIFLLHKTGPWSSMPKNVRREGGVSLHFCRGCALAQVNMGRAEAGRAWEIPA